MCPFREIDRKFPTEWKAWFDNLTRLYQWRKAGYNLDGEGLAFADWQALAEITRYWEVKDAEAQVRARSGLV